MFTVESLRQRYVGSKPLFDDQGNFNPENLNSGQDMIRSKLDDIICPGIQAHIVLYNMIIHAIILFEDDQWYIIINVFNIESYSMEENKYDTYVVSWYKGRGCTEVITKNNKLITIGEYVELLNILEEHDFFNPKKWS